MRIARDAFEGAKDAGTPGATQIMDLIRYNLRSEEGVIVVDSDGQEWRLDDKLQGQLIGKKK